MLDPQDRLQIDVGPLMILAVTTIKDSLDNVRRFVHRNLAGGVDHLVVFLDAPARDVADYLSQHDHVTVVRAFGDWWAGSRPAGLNARQAINASVTARLVAETSWCDWLFHIDGDEAVHVDRAVLDSVGPDYRSVQLASLEAVSHPDLRGPSVWFKRVLTEDELALIDILGVLEDATNHRYFRGHVKGKVGVRPARDLLVGVHFAFDRAGRRVKSFEHERLLLQHYESVTSDEFARKWRAMATSGAPARQRLRRDLLQRAVSALLAQGLDQKETDHFLRQMYLRHAVDDVDTLRRLGLLVHVDLDAKPEIPRRLPDDERHQLREMLRRARLVQKWSFHPRRQGDDMDEIAAGLRWDAPVPAAD